MSSSSYTPGQLKVEGRSGEVGGRPSTLWSTPLLLQESAPLTFPWVLPCPGRLHVADFRMGGHWPHGWVSPPLNTSPKRQRDQWGPATLSALCRTLAPREFFGSLCRTSLIWALTMMLHKSWFGPLLGTPLSEPELSQHGISCAVLLQTWLAPFTGRQMYFSSCLRRTILGKVCWRLARLAGWQPCHLLPKI